jgi:hypothetical protein
MLFTRPCTGSFLAGLRILETKMIRLRSLGVALVAFVIAAAMVATFAVAGTALSWPMFVDRAYAWWLCWTLLAGLVGALSVLATGRSTSPPRPPPRRWQ